MKLPTKFPRNARIIRLRNLITHLPFPLVVKIAVRLLTLPQTPVKNIIYRSAPAHLTKTPKCNILILLITRNAYPLGRKRSYRPNHTGLAPLR